MIRVHVICEGQTEEMFINELLLEPFMARGILLQPALVGKPGHKGGNVKFERIKADVENRLLGDRNAYCTTFFDYYGLPQSFPGKDALPAEASIKDKAQAVEQALVAQLTRHLGENAMRRFIPFVQMYEFEALLFSDPAAFAQGVDKPELAPSFTAIAEAFDTPEHINNSPQTAPSKRIEQLIHDYEKPLMGALAALEVGLQAMSARCPLFHHWLQRLEQLKAEPQA